ncbi:hypothetical protein Tco_1562082 [Tanacetum coccineum]
MAQLKYCDKHNQVGFLFKPTESAGYTEIVDFLRSSKLRYALTNNPPIYDSLVKQFWQTATARTLADGTQQLNATIDSIEYTITEESVRRQLQLADASGINMLQNEEIFAGLQNIGSKSGGWDQFGSNIATALISIVKLVKKVKKMEAVLKRRHVVLTDSEDEDAENSSKQGRNLQEEGLDEMVRSIMKEKSEEFETPTQGKTSGEADISPEGLEAAETLAKVLTQRTKTYTRKVKTGLRRKLDADEVSTGEGINTGFTDVNTAFEEINSGDESIIPSPKKGQREGKAVLEEKSQSKRTKKQIREEQASLAEIVRLQAQEEAENARKAELERQDALIAKRVQDELELSETQKNRMAQVQEAAKYYTEEDWDSVRAKLEANRDLSSKVLSIDFSSDDFAKKMVELINEKKRLYKEQRERDRRNRPMTQAEQREYMIKYLKSQEKVEKFIPMNSKLEASKLKRTGINLQAKVFKKQKITDVPDVTKDESVKREEKFKVQQPILRYNVRKSLARKGLQKNKSESARSDTEEDVEAYMDERVDEPSSEEFQMGSIPQGSAPAKIVKWQILKTGKKGAYQIIREDHTDVVYVNFQGLLNDLTRDDLKELYRLMMLKYGDSRPEEEYERVLWGDLKTMFDPPSTEDAVWSLTHQQKVLSWRYFHSCAVHCLTLEAAHIYMLTEVKYPLPSRVCQAMLEKKLIGDRKDEVCYQLLKLIERQAQQQ